MAVFSEALESRCLLSAASMGGVTPAEKAALKKLGTDLFAILAKSNVTTTQVLQLAADAKTALTGAIKPSSASAKALATELRSLKGKTPLTAEQEAAVMVDVQNVLASANVSSANAQTVSNDISGIVTASGVTTPQVKLLIGDVKALAQTLKG